METIREEVFEHNHESYQLRLIKSNDSYEVLAFLGTQQITSMSATNETVGDYKSQNKESAIELLFEEVKSRIISI